jgi:hypothetical protein
LLSSVAFFLKAIGGLISLRRAPMIYRRRVSAALCICAVYPIMVSVFLIVFFRYCPE